MQTVQYVAAALVVSSSRRIPKTRIKMYTNAACRLGKNCGGGDKLARHAHRGMDGSL